MSGLRAPTGRGVVDVKPSKSLQLSGSYVTAQLERLSSTAFGKPAEYLTPISATTVMYSFYSTN